MAKRPPGLTPEMEEAIIARTKREVAEQGLPMTVTDPVILGKIARLVARHERTRQAAS